MDWLIFIFLVLVLWYWWDTLQSKEIARVAGKNACQRASVQFLDDTVQLKKFWLRRNLKGHVEICRLYFFEFSSDGTQRYSGRITLLGKKVGEVEMDAYRIPSDIV
ncbi:DUF3301 domain-containing protein [Kaarinaea lacus]